MADEAAAWTSTRAPRRALRNEARSGLPSSGETQGAEALAERGNGVVAHATDLAAAEIDHGKGLEHIIELRGAEVDVELLIAGDAGLVFEVSDTIFVEDDAADGEFGGGLAGFRGAGLGGSLAARWAEDRGAGWAVFWANPDPSRDSSARGSTASSRLMRSP